MENKEVKLIAFKALHGFLAIEPILEATVESMEVTATNSEDEEIKFEPIKAIKDAVKQIANLAMENIELKNQLQAKDKALERACAKLESIGSGNILDDFCPALVDDFMPKCCGEDFCEGSNKECWKEWCENGID